MNTTPAEPSSTCRYPVTAHLISTARQRSGLEQQEFIDKHGLSISQATFSRWETGHIQVSVDVLIQLGLAKVVQP